MRVVFLTLLFAFVWMTSFSQKISYSIPEGYESDITKEDYKKIVDIAVPIVSKRYKITQVKDGTIELKKGQDMQAFNLHNLIAKCVEVTDKSVWNKIIEEHFDKIFSSIDEQKKIDPAKFETVRSYLSLRVYPNETINQRGGIANFLTRTDIEGTSTMLMLDLGGAFTPVQRQYFKLWKKDSSEVFRIAQDNVNQHTIEKVTQEFEMDSSKIEISLLGNEDYAASYALDLIHNSPELVGQWGSVVAIPNKGLVNLCKVSPQKPLDFVKFIQYTRQLINQYYDEHEQPVSREFYWYYKGKFTMITVMTTPDGSINVISPPGLTDLMTEEK